MSQLEVFDWLVTKRRTRKSRVTLPDCWSAPSRASTSRPGGSRVARNASEKPNCRLTKKRRAEERERLAHEAEATSERAREEAIRRFWISQSDEERREMESDALAQASTIQQEVLNRGGLLSEATRKSLLDSYALRLLQQAA